MLVKDAQTAIRARSDSHPSLVLCGWLESSGDLCQPLSKKGQTGLVTYPHPSQSLNFLNSHPL